MSEIANAYYRKGQIDVLNEVLLMIKTHNIEPRSVDFLLGIYRIEDMIREYLNKLTAQ